MNEVLGAQWNSFFGSLVGASAALLGLVFVAISINQSRIVPSFSLRSRAGETLILLASALVAALAALIPGQPLTVFGAEILAVAIIPWTIPVVFQWQTIRLREVKRRWYFWARVVLHQLAALPTIISGVLLMGHHVNGDYWLSGGLMLTLVVGVVNGWVLLVEISR
jgi:hypothetical protein